MRHNVSVVIPCLNGELYLAEAINSVLNQSYEVDEIIVVDNGSTDTSKEIAMSFPKVKYIFFAERNQVLARNYGCCVAEGDYITFLDQDDIWLSEKTQLQLKFLENNPDHIAVIGLQKMFLQPGCQKPSWLKQEFLNTSQPAYLPSAMMVRKKTIYGDFSFDENFNFTSDVAWFFKAKEIGLQIGVINEILLHRRIHDTNLSFNLPILHSEYLKIISQSLKSRRDTCV